MKMHFLALKHYIRVAMKSDIDRSNNNFCDHHHTENHHIQLKIEIQQMQQIMIFSAGMRNKNLFHKIL